MKATELRLGNLIMSGRSVVNVITILRDGVRVQDGDNNYRVPMHVYSPVPLTEEWLTSFGFCQNEKYFSIKTG